MATVIGDGVADDERDGPTMATVDGERRIAYAEYGPPDGTPVVFLHGTPGSRRLAALFEEAAVEHGVRLLAPDRPGYGRSTPWPDRSIGDAGEVVAAVLDDVGVPAAGLVAFSGGAPHALATAATHPERVRRLDVVAGASPPAVGVEPPPVQRLLAGLAARTPRLLGGLLRGQAWLAARLDPSLVVDQYTAGERAEPVPERVAEVVRADFVTALSGHAGGAVTEFRATAREWDIEYRAITAGTRFWHGDGDTNVPVAGVRALVDRLPAARLELVEGADHLGTLLESVPQVLADHGRAGD